MVQSNTVIVDTGNLTMPTKIKKTTGIVTSPVKTIVKRKKKTDATGVRRKDFFKTKHESSGTPAQEQKAEEARDRIELDTNGSLVLISYDTAEQEDLVQARKQAKLLFWLLDILATFFWLYCVTQLFIFDVVGMLFATLAPSFGWIANYKFVGVLVFLIFQLFTWKRSVMMLFNSYLLFFPFVVIFWKIPNYLIFARDWRIPFALISTSLRFFQSFRLHFSLFAIWLMAGVIGVVAKDRVLLTLAIVCLLGVTLINYVLRLGSAFQGDLLNDKAKAVLKLAADNLAGKSTIQELKGKSVSEMGEKQVEQWRSDLELTMLYSRAVLYTARQFRDYQSSGMAALGSLLTIVRMFIGTVTTFAVIFYGIFKIDASQMVFNVTPNFFRFFYFSFNTMLLNSIDDMRASGQLAQSVVMIEIFVGFTLVAILITLLFSIRMKRVTEEVNTLIEILENQSNEAYRFIGETFGLQSIDTVLLEINKMQHSLTRIILQMLGRRRR
jgi:hypothetical protein